MSLPVWLSFLDMGKNSVYVWSAWLLTLVAIGLFIIISWRQRQVFYRQQLMVLQRLKKR